MNTLQVVIPLVSPDFSRTYVTFRPPGDIFGCHFQFPHTMCIGDSQKSFESGAAWALAPYGIECDKNRLVYFGVSTETTAGLAPVLGDDYAVRVFAYLLKKDERPRLPKIDDVEPARYQWKLSWAYERENLMLPLMASAARYVDTSIELIRNMLAVLSKRRKVAVTASEVATAFIALQPQFKPEKCHRRKDGTKFIGTYKGCKVFSSSKFESTKFILSPPH